MVGVATGTHTERVELSCGAVWFDGADVMWVELTDGLRLDATTTREVIDARRELSQGRAWPVLADIRGLRGATRAARRMSASDEVAAITTRMALLVGSSVSEVVGNFFLKVNRPRFPTRLFRSPERALAWLREEGAGD